ncbi:MAG: helix-hairpin-helix domain-containing protein [Planctomycetota bacterium]
MSQERSGEKSLATASVRQENDDRRSRGQSAILLFLVISVPLGTLWTSTALPDASEMPAATPQPFRLEANRAAVADFELLPGIGPKLAARIVDDRNRHGPFLSLEDLSRVPGIGDKTIRTIAAYCDVRAPGRSEPTRVAQREDSPKTERLPGTKAESTQRSISR